MAAGWIIEGGGGASPHFRRNIFLTEDRIEWLRDHFYNINVYTTVLSYDSSDQMEALKYGAFYVDLDSKNDFELVRHDALRILTYLDVILGIPKERVQLYYSGYKGIHLIVPPEVMGVKPDPALHYIYRLMAEDLERLSSFDPQNTKPNGDPKRTMDLAIYDHRRLFRLTNSINGKSGLYKIPLTYEELQTMSVHDIRALAQSPRTLYLPQATLSLKAQGMYQGFVQRWQARASRTRPITTEVHGRLKNAQIPPCIQHLLNHPVAEGRRNSTAIALASFFNQQGLSQDQAMEAMSTWGESRCAPAMSETEIRNVVNSAYKNGYTFGCSAISSLSVCDREHCPLRRR